jgi:hypothetical protein
MVDLRTTKMCLSLLKTFLDFWRKMFPKKESSRIYYEIPKHTIVVAPNPDPHATWWHMGFSSGQPAMQVVGRFNVTNVTKYAVILSAVKMRKPKYMGTVMVKDSISNYHGMYQIPSGSYTDMSLDFWIIPPFKKQGESFIADVAVLDQFGNEHWIKKVNFRYC